MQDILVDNGIILGQIPEPGSTRIRETKPRLAVINSQPAKIKGEIAMKRNL